MPEAFNYDFFSLKDANIAEWNKRFFWPVARETTTQIITDFHGKIKEIVNELGDTFAGDCLLIGWHIGTLSAEVVNHYLSIQRIKRKGCRIDYSNKMRLIPMLLGDRPVNFYKKELWALGNGGFWKGMVKSALKSIYVNGRSLRMNVTDHFRAGGCVFAFPDENIRRRSYTEGLSTWVRITSPEEWFDRRMRRGLPAAFKAQLEDISDVYLRYVKKYAMEEFGISIPHGIIEGLRLFAEGFLVDIGMVYRSIQDRVGRKRPNHLLTPTGGKTFVRALSLAVREAGGKVTGFPHGYFICHYSSPRVSIHELSTVDEFMAYSPGSVDLFNRYLEIHPPARRNRVSISHDNSPALERHWTQNQRKQVCREIRTVMVLELSLELEWAGYHCAEAMVNYHFYYRLCEVMAQNGYKVVFKRRPASPDWDGIRFFEGIDNVRVTSVPFESHGLIDQVDAVICQYGMSSTLYWAMCTNKTVIYADAGWEPWFEDVYELMAKRCRILHCWYDERNIQCFDKAELLEILRKPPEEPDTQFLKRYLFPTQGT